MLDHDELRTLRGRHADLSDTQDRALNRSTGGAVSLVVKTVAVTTYPTTAASFYGVQRTDPGGTEAEGNVGTFGSPGGTFYALNLGSVVPPVGTTLVIALVGSRWIFRYDG